MKLSEVLSLLTKQDVDKFLKKYSKMTLDEPSLTEEKVMSHFRYVGDKNSNASTIDSLSDSGKGLVERITNGIDAVIERTRADNNSKPNLDDILRTGFPKYSRYRNNIIHSNGSKDMNLKALDADDLVKVMIHDGSSGLYPTVDIIDKGTGIDGKDFASTILSLQGGNKINLDKDYLIGSFGQGGSTSLAFSVATLILSKINNSIYFTIVKRAKIRDMKLHVYCYLVDNDRLPFVIEPDLSNIENTHLRDFIHEESGTLVRMIDIQIDKQLRGTDITKPTGLIDYINTELFDVKIPIKLIDNRQRFCTSPGYQNRNAMGSMMKLKTTSFVKRDYSGTYQIPFENCYVDVDYYIILPANEDDWGKDKVCEQKYKEFNAHDKPVFYTVNGQYITGDGFTRLSNGGLNFLKHRLMVNVNLDKLGTDKYKFFTTDRSRIKKIDSSTKLFDDVVDRLTKDPKLLYINDIIARKAISSDINQDILDEVKDTVLNDYRDFLNSQGVKRKRRPGDRRPPAERELFHYIDSLEIPTNRQEYYRNEQINIKLVTNAYKNVNMDAQIDCFVNDHFFSEMDANYKNGEIIYDFTKLDSGNYSVFFQITKETIITSNKYSFTIIDDLKEKDESKNINTGDLDLKIEIVDEKETICDVVKQMESKAIRIYLCFSHPDLEFLFFDVSESKAIEIKQKLLHPISSFGLFYKSYDTLEVEEKNDLMRSYIRSVINKL